MKAYSEKVKINLSISNNFFSYEKRHRKEIIVPILKEGNIENVKESDSAAFIEFDEDGLEKTCLGLEYFIKLKDKEVYIFDNHNHSFYFSYKLFLETNKKYDFIHIDQHKDLRTPEIIFDVYKSKLLKEKDTLKAELKKLNLDWNNYIDNEYLELEKLIAYLYTNTELNVGNFIKPLMKEGVIDEFYCIDSLYKMQEFKTYDYKRDYILDLDLDFFSKEMDYIKYEEKLELVKTAVKNAKLVLVATSPYFIEFDRCMDVIAKIFE